MLRDITRPTISSGGGTGLNIYQNSQGIVLFRDSSRNKDLSIDRETFSFGIDHRNITGKRWMKLIGSVIASTSGYKVPRDATITSMTVQSQNNIIQGRFNIRKNNSATNVYTGIITSNNEFINNNLNIDINGGDYIQLFMSILSGNVDFPVVTIEIAWR